MNMDEKDFEQQEQVLSKATENSENDVIETLDNELNSADKETEIETETDSEFSEGSEVSDLQKEKSEDKIKKQKKQKKNFKRLKHGTMATVLTVVFIVVLVLVNIVATSVFERFPLTIDMTSDESYTISDETADYIKGVDKEVKITVLSEESEFTSTSKYIRQSNEILKNIVKSNKNFSIEYIDLLSNPEVKSEYEDSLSEYDIIVESGKNHERTTVVHPQDLVNFSNDFETSFQQNMGGTLDSFIEYYGGMTAIQNYPTGIESNCAEQAITSAILKVTDANPVTVTLLTGRNELTSLSYFQSLLNANGYIVNSVDITTQDIPKEANLIVMGAPSVDYTAEEVEKVSAFLDNDEKLEKNLLYIESVQQPDTPNIDELLEEYGIKFRDEFVYDSNGSNASNGYVFMERSSDKFMDDIKDDSLRLFTSLYTKPITIEFDEKNMRTCEAYIQTSDTGYTMDKNSKELTNGVTVTAAVGSKAAFIGDKTNYSNLIALGSEFFLDDTVLQMSQYLNRQWILSIINGVTGKSSGITIEPKTVEGGLFDLTNTQIRVLEWVFIVIIPVIVLALGIIIWIRRKNR